MSYVPSIAVGNCPNCGNHPDVRHKGLFSLSIRLECKCGVAGAWVRWETWEPNGWNVASRGWRVIASDLPRPPPPRGGSAAIPAAGAKP